MDIKECYIELGGDYNDALSRLISDAFVVRFVKKFSQTQEYAELVKAKEEGDKPEIYRLVHTIKGMAINLSFTKLYNVCYDFCENYKKMDFSNFDSDLEKVISEYSKDIDIIKQLD